jgi:hypothetical protein
MKLALYRGGETWNLNEEVDFIANMHPGSGFLVSRDRPDL